MKVFNSDQIFTTHLNRVLVVKILVVIRFTLPGSLGRPREYMSGNRVILPTVNDVGDYQQQQQFI